MIKKIPAGLGFEICVITKHMSIKTYAMYEDIYIISLWKTTTLNLKSILTINTAWLRTELLH